MSTFILAASQAGTIVQGVITIFAILGAVIWLLERRNKKDAAQSLNEQIAASGRIERRLGDLMVFTNPARLGVVKRIVDSSGLAEKQTATLSLRPITADLKASVESAGNVSATRGRNLAAKALGGALVPGGIFIFGNARETIHDHRELYLILEARDWSATWSIDPTLGAQARELAGAINVHANALRPRESVLESSAPVDGDVLGQLERLTKLRDAGTLSPEEFATQKSVILSTARSEPGASKRGT